MRRKLALGLVVWSVLAVGCATAEDPTDPTVEEEDTGTLEDSIAADTTTPVDSATLEDSTLEDSTTADTRVADTRADTRTDAASDAREASVVDASDGATTDGATLDDGATDDGGDDAATDAMADAATDTSADSGLGVGCRVVINEVQTGASSATNEWIELYNACDGEAAVGGFRLVYRSNNGTSDVEVFTFAAGARLGPKAFFLVGNTGYTGTKDGDFRITSNQLAVGGGGIALRPATGSTFIDRVAYGSAVNNHAFTESKKTVAPDDTSPPHSIARTADGADTNSNLNDFALTSTPTPRAANTITP